MDETQATYGGSATDKDDADDDADDDDDDDEEEEDDGDGDGHLMMVQAKRKTYMKLQTTPPKWKHQLAAARRLDKAGLKL